MNKQTNLSKLLIFVVVALNATSVLSSGVFEVNLASLLANTGKDLRDDCCNWLSNQRTSNNNKLSFVSDLASEQIDYQQQQQQQNQCDQDKCQLFVKICVKYYQTTIDPSQCTFGELNAQVLHQHLNNNNHHHQNQYHQQHKAINPHYQRMLQQQQQFSSSNSNYQRFAPQSSRQQQSYQNNNNHGNGKQRVMRTIAFNQPIQFPFNFTWPGSFSLIIEAWYEVAAGDQQQHEQHQNQLLIQTRTLSGSLADNSYLSSVIQTHNANSMLINNNNAADSHHLQHISSRKQNIIRHSMNGWLSVKNEWTNGVHQTDKATLTYSYRVMCQSNYYGEQCAILCRPRDDAYGHYRCSNTGEIVCLPGWHGNYCSEPTCLPGCHKIQGNCSRPNECTCRYGWQGALCDQCIRYPGCVHGSCRKPHECVCEEGWGGLLCNEDLNYCTNHRPCKNNALCTNTFDENGTGSYTCTCPIGFLGKNCDKRIQSKCTNDSPCLNGGECYELESKDLHCSCPPGFTGRYCETTVQQPANTVPAQPPAARGISSQQSRFATNRSAIIEPVSYAASCMPNPCKNGGTCIGLDNDFECNCQTAFKGKICEVLTNEELLPGSILDVTDNNNFATNNNNNKQEPISNSNNRDFQDKSESNSRSYPPQPRKNKQTLPQHSYALAPHHGTTFLPTFWQSIGYSMTILTLILFVFFFMDKFGARRVIDSSSSSSFVEDATLQNHQNEYRTSGASTSSLSAQSTIKSRSSTRTEKTTMAYDECDSSLNNSNSLDQPPPPAYHYHAAQAPQSVISPTYAAATACGGQLQDSINQIYGLTNHYYHTNHYTPSSLLYACLAPQQQQHQQQQHQTQSQPIKTSSRSKKSPKQHQVGSAATLQHQYRHYASAANSANQSIYAHYTSANAAQAHAATAAATAAVAAVASSRPPHYSNDTTTYQRLNKLRKTHSYAANINQQHQDANLQQLAQQQQPLYQAMGSKAGSSSSRPVLVLSIMDLPYATGDESSSSSAESDQEQSNDQHQHHSETKRQQQHRDSSDDDDALC